MMKKKELYIVIGIAVIALIAIFFLKRPVSNDHQPVVAIKHKDQIVQTFNPNEDAIYHIKGSYGTLDVEVQDGWKGRIIPFELVQTIFLKDLKNNIDDKNNRLEEITGSYSEIIDELSEDDKEILKDLLNDDNDAFKNSEVSKRAKVISKGNEDILSEELQQVVLGVDNLINEEKKIKSELKDDNIKLLEETKAKIECLNGDEVYDLLNKKWIIPMVNNIDKITHDLINDFSKNIDKISDKYLTTLSDLENEISKTESELSSMIDELTANEFDMKGLMEFKFLLEGDSNGRK